MSINLKRKGVRNVHYKKIGAIAVMTITLFASCLSVSAEEIEPAGYHVYEVQEDQASDNWYGIARGDILQAAVSKITKGSAAKYASCSGTTFAHQECDRVFVRVYLDQSDNGTNGWWTVNYWTGETHGSSMAHVSTADYQITRDKYYRVKGSHSVTESDITEVTTTCTNALYFD